MPPNRKLLVPLVLTPLLACALLAPKPEEPKDPLDHRILFASGDVQLDPRAEAQVATISAYLKAHPELLVVRVSGHAGADETTEEATDLDRRRSRAVVDRLIDQGVAAERLAVGRYGTTRPVDTSDSDAARQRNRRVEFDVVEREEESSAPLDPGPIEP